MGRCFTARPFSDPRQQRVRLATQARRSDTSAQRGRAGRRGERQPNRELSKIWSTLVSPSASCRRRLLLAEGTCRQQLGFDTARRAGARAAGVAGTDPCARRPLIASRPRGRTQRSRRSRSRARPATHLRTRRKVSAAGPAAVTWRRGNSATARSARKATLPLLANADLSAQAAAAYTGGLTVPRLSRGAVDSVLTTGETPAIPQSEE